MTGTKSVRKPTSKKTSKPKPDRSNLLPDHEGRWVLYRGTKRIEFGDTRYELFQKCSTRGWKPEDVYVGHIEPLDPSIKVDELLATVET
jgi:hypothetical protein